MSKPKISFDHLFLSLNQNESSLNEKLQSFLDYPKFINEI